MTITTTLTDSETGAPIDEPLYTAYACAKVVNAQLAEMGLDIVLPGQMFYNYVKQDMLATVDVKGTNGKTQKLVKESTLAEWLVKYLERKAKAAAKKATKIAQA